MAATLEQILSATRRRVADARQNADLPALERAAAGHVPRGFAAALRRSAHRPAVIAELKKASPSRGLIRADFPVAVLATQLEQSGASALSVLTEPEFFQGSLKNLREASAATKLPCLRKDFIIDNFQLLESRAHAADAVLLIVAALTETSLAMLHGAARQLGLEVLCEVHDEEELKRALAAGAEIVGVNSRNLKTMAVDINTLLRLAPLIPANILRVAESGITSREDIDKLHDAGYHAFLIGETLMRSVDPGAALRGLTTPSSRLAGRAR